MKNRVICMDGESVLRDPNLQIIFGVTLMAVLGVVSITPAFPTIQREFSIEPQAVAMLITAFTLPAVFLAPVFGVLSDRWGRKKVLVPSLFVFALAGGACSFVRSFESLVYLRLVQGIGVTALGTLNVTIIGDLYSGRRRALAMGYNASVLNLGTACYPAIGGALAALGWYYPFTLPLAALPIAFVVLFRLESPEPESRAHFRRYLSGLIGHLRKRRAAALFLASFSTFVLLYGANLAYLPFLMEGSFEASPVAIGVVLSVMSLGAAAASSQMGRLTGFASAPTLLGSAFICYALALAIVPSASTFTLIVLPVLIFGIAHGISVPTLQTLLAEAVTTEERGSFMAVGGTFLRLGQTVGPVLMGAVFARSGISSVFYAGALISACTWALLLFLMR